MSDILIKDVEIPNDGTVTLILHPNGDVYFGTAIKDIKIGTAIELPPHGDLIDRNELPLTCITDYKLEGHSVIEFEDVLNAPVIVEANI